MQAKAIVIMPYFGKLPDMFPFWVRSVERITRIEWRLIPDSPIPCRLPNNVKLVTTTFSSIQKRIRDHFCYDVTINVPYDLCAFKPAYGDIFEEECRGYDFFGYGDFDVVYGNLDKYLTDEVFESYDKIFCMGHLSLIRNNEFGRGLYAKQLSSSKLNCQDAFNGRVSCFDEVMINEIARENNWQIMVFPFADFYPRFQRFNLIPRYSNDQANSNFVADVEVNRTVFSWTENGLFRYWVKNGDVQDQEFAYIHFFRRDMEIKVDPMAKDGFCIVPNAYIPQPDRLDPKFILSRTKLKVYWKYILPRLRIGKLLRRFSTKRAASM